MSFISKAFKTLGHGIGGIAEGAFKNLKGGVKMIGGVVTLRPSLIKAGAKQFDEGVKSAITGLGDVAGGGAGALVGLTPLGAVVNHLTNGAATRLAEGTFKGTAKTVVDGRTGAENVVLGTLTGDRKRVANGFVDASTLAMLVIPGLGEADALSIVGKGLVESGFNDAVAGLPVDARGGGEPAP